MTVPAKEFNFKALSISATQSPPAAIYYRQIGRFRDLFQVASAPESTSRLFKKSLLLVWWPKLTLPICDSRERKPLYRRPSKRAQMSQGKDRKRNAWRAPFPISRPVLWSTGICSRRHQSIPPWQRTLRRHLTVGQSTLRHYWESSASSIYNQFSVLKHAAHPPPICC